MARPVSILDITETERMELQRLPQLPHHGPARQPAGRHRCYGVEKASPNSRWPNNSDVSKTCVNKWSQRFEREGLEGLEDFEKDEDDRPRFPRTRWSK